MKKRVLALLLVLVIAFSLLPLSALAAAEEIAETVEEADVESVVETTEEAAEETEESTEEAAGEADISLDGSSGTCGDNLTWTLENGVLTIRGTGAMENYTFDSEAPWCSYESDVTSAVIGSGVTSIGDYAFSDCTSLMSITIPAGVTSIGNCAFYRCGSLTSVTIPDSVTSIGYYAFHGCKSLTSITIPDGVTSIEHYAFSVCISLTSITIPDSVTSIGEYAFAGCTSLVSIMIPDSVTSIGYYMFTDCTALKSVAIPDSMTSIEVGAFSNCVSLENIAIPDSVTSIESGAFYNCVSLENIAIPDSVTSIGWGAFEGCTSLTSIAVDKNNVNYCSGDGVLFNKEKTTLICYPAGKKESSYSIPPSVTSIEPNAFSGCISLTSVTIPDSVTSIGESAFDGCTALKSITIPDSVTRIEPYAFSSCISLTSITIPDNVTSIGWGAFSNCTSLTSITIPDNVTSIGESAFGGCASLADVYYGGSEDQWNEIWIVPGKGNSYLTSANIHYNQGGGSRDNSIIFGIDQWRFSNSGHYFTDDVTDRYGNYVETYYISNADYQTLISGLSKSEIRRVNNLRHKNWGGSCYGMSATAVLTKMGALEADDIVSGKTNLYSIVKTNNDAAESVINFYHVQQLTNAAQNNMSAFMKKSTKTQLATIEEMASQVSAGGYPFVLCFYGDGWGHAVVAYGVEHGTYSFGGSKYDSRILIYDCNYPNEATYLYYNTGTERWKFQKYSNATKLGFACNDVSILNYVDYGTAVSNESARLVFTGDAEQYSLLYDGQTTQIDSSTDDRENGLVTYFDDNLMADGTYAESNMTLTLPDLSGDYSVIPEAGACDFALYYENSAVSAVCDGAKQIDFDADGGVSASGVSGEYTLSLMFDDGYSTSPWYKTVVSGSDAEEISLTQLEDGILIEGDNLQDVEVTVSDEDETLMLKLSTDDDSALLVSLTDEEENKPVILLDTDGDGDYETEYEPVTVPGDFTGDGEVTILDVLALLKSVAGITDELPNGDVNRDGSVDILDVLQLLKYVAGILTEL